MPTKTLPFGEWLPDQAPIGLQGATVATNVIPDLASYRAFPQLQIFTSSIGSRCKGGTFAVDAAKNNYNYIGDSTALYSLLQASFGDVTRAGGAYSMGSTDFWEFAPWGNTVIAVNGFGDLPQQITLGATNFANLSTGVKARHIAVLRDFVVLGNVSDSATNVNRVRWCAINNPASFTVDAATLADFQDLPPEGGEVQKILGGEYGIVLQERAMWRMQFVGSPLIFQFDQVEASIGAYVPQAAVRYENLVFFLSREGFHSFDGANLSPIGRGKVDRFFHDDVSTNNIDRIHAAIDPTNKLVVWAYPSNNNTGGNPDKLLAYSWAFNRWVLIEGLMIDYLFQAATTSYTLEGLDAIADLDHLPVSLDSAQWTGGQIILSAFNTLHRLGRFNGAAMGATVDTAEFQLFEDKRGMITEVRPILVGVSASATVTLLNRNNLTESVSVGAVATSPIDTGFAPFRQTARYFRVRIVTSANVDFTHLIGVEVQAAPSGVR